MITCVESVMLEEVVSLSMVNSLTVIGISCDPYIDLGLIGFACRAPLFSHALTGCIMLVISGL